MILYGSYITDREVRHCSITKQQLSNGCDKGQRLQISSFLQSAACGREELQNMITAIQHMQRTINVLHNRDDII